MVALAAAGVFANPASLLARYAGPPGAGLDRAGRGGAAHGASPAAPARRDEVAPPALGGPAVLAQISEAARSLFAQMREQGVQSASFDFHLKIDQVGVSVDGRGNRAVEGHSLSVDLRVEARQGVMLTEDGPVQFESLQVEFEMTETHVLAHERADQPVGGGLDESLRALGKLFSEATRGSDQTSFDLDDMLAALDDQVDRMHDLLARIGRALEERAGRSADRGDGADGQSTGAQVQSIRTSLELSLRSLLFTRSAPGDPVDQAPASDPVAPAGV